MINLIITTIIGVFEFFIFYLIKMNKKRRPQTATNDVRTMGGKEMVLNRMVNHYKAIANVKPKVNTEEPFRLENRNQSGLVTSKIFVIQKCYMIRSSIMCGRLIKVFLMLGQGLTVRNHLHTI
jgi:hypothetical protein